MKYCAECGKQVPDEAKFCPLCGKAILNDSKSCVTREQVFEGKLHKCPNCGALVDAFDVQCNQCGYVFRDKKSPDSVIELSDKINIIESQRTEIKTRKTFLNITKREQDDTDKQIINTIRSFPIPNNKEDILEFMILASSNIDYKAYEDDGRNSSRDISDAWVSKMEQAYKKAELSFSDDSEFIEIKKMYDSSLKKIKKQKYFVWKILGGIYGAIFLILIFMITLSSIDSPRKNAEEETRLNAILVEIDECISNGEYKRALVNAESIEYKGNDSEAKRKWMVEKETTIYEIITIAKENGVELETSVNNTDDEVNIDSSSDVSSGFVEGFKEAIQPGLDKAKQSIEEYKESLNSKGDE